MFQIIVSVVSITFVMDEVPNGQRKTKGIIQLDKVLSKQYLNDDEYNIIDIRLTVAINITAIS